MPGILRACKLPESRDGEQRHIISNGDSGRTSTGLLQDCAHHSQYMLDGVTGLAVDSRNLCTTIRHCLRDSLRSKCLHHTSGGCKLHCLSREAPLRLLDRAASCRGSTDSEAAAHERPTSPVLWHLLPRTGAHLVTEADPEVAVQKENVRAALWVPQKGARHPSLSESLVDPQVAAHTKAFLAEPCKSFLLAKQLNLRVT